MDTNSKEFKDILLKTHNEYRRHSALWGKKKEIEAICDRTGLDKKTAKKALFDMEHPYGKEYLSQKPVPAKRHCPSCGGTNYHAFVEERVIREGKVKTRTSLNLNPLKPFTVFNHKEKVVRKPIITQVGKFVCDDCGKIFR